MSNKYIIHGMLQDVIDYSNYIKVCANTPCTFPYRVTKSRKSKKSSKKRKNNKGRSLKLKKL